MKGVPAYFYTGLIGLVNAQTAVVCMSVISTGKYMLSIYCD